MQNIFGERLKNIRNALNLSQRAISEELKTTIQSYQGWEYGKNVPAFDKLSPLNKKYLVNLNWLSSGTGSMFDDDTNPTPPPPADSPTLEDHQHAAQLIQDYLGDRVPLITTVSRLIWVVALKIRAVRERGGDVECEVKQLIKDAMMLVPEFAKSEGKKRKK